MRQQRTRVVINVGNLLELAGAGVAVYGVDRLAGLAWALVLAGMLAVIAAELIYDAHVWRIPLPHRPRTRQRLCEWRQHVRVWRMRRVQRWRRWRADHNDRVWTGRDSL